MSNLYSIDPFKQLSYIILKDFYEEIRQNLISLDSLESLKLDVIK